MARRLETEAGIRYFGPKRIENRRTKGQEQLSAVPYPTIVRLEQDYSCAHKSMPESESFYRLSSAFSGCGFAALRPTSAALWNLQSVI